MELTKYIQGLEWDDEPCVGHKRTHEQLERDAVEGERDHHGCLHIGQDAATEYDGNDPKQSLR